MPGSKPGERRGGRIAGTPNKATTKRQAEIAASGLTPLEFMLNVMRESERDVMVRLEAAKAAAPYVHPKLASVEVRGQVTHTGEQVATRPVTSEEAERAYAAMCDAWPGSKRN